MRIGLVTDCYKPVTNGVTRMVELYKDHLEQRGHETTVITFGNQGQDQDNYRVVKSPAKPLGNTGYYFTWHLTPTIQRLLLSLDIVHCHHLFFSLPLARKYARCPIVYTNHTRYDLYAAIYSHLPLFVTNIFMRWAWPRFTEHADLVIAPSESLRQVLLKFKVSRPIQVIENGIELAPFHKPLLPRDKLEWGWHSNNVVAIFVGRMASEKRVSMLIKEFAAAYNSVSELRLLLIGDGPELPSLREYVYSVGLNNYIHFVGKVPFEDIPNYLAAGDVFVTASITEVHPVTVVEALAAGLPVIGISSPGLVDIVESGLTGMLVPNLVGNLATALIHLAADSIRRQEMGQNARRASSRYSISQTVDNTLEVYQSLLNSQIELQHKPYR